MPVWIMDAFYRGYIQMDNPNPDTSVYFRGEYESVYGVVYDMQPTDCLMTTTNDDVCTLDVLINEDGPSYANSGHDFYNYQNHSSSSSTDDAEQKNLNVQSAKDYSLGSHYFLSTKSGKPLQSMSAKEKYVMINRTNYADYNSYEYSTLLINTYYAAQLGINFMDAPGVMLNGVLFQAP
jgi:hypothetical protein